MKLNRIWDILYASLLDVAEDGIVKVTRNLTAKGSELAFILDAVYLYVEIFKAFLCV